jgi:IS30 family transposase
MTALDFEDRENIKDARRARRHRHQKRQARRGAKSQNAIKQTPAFISNRIALPEFKAVFYSAAQSRSAEPGIAAATDRSPNRWPR